MQIEELLKKYTPTQIEKLLESACPHYEPAESTFSDVYQILHEVVNNVLAVAIQSQLGHVSISTEQNLSGSNGRLDIRVSIRNGKLNIRNSSTTIAVIELKTGRLKLIQPAIYAYLEGVDVLLVGLRTPEVQVVTPSVAEALLNVVADYVEKKEKLKKEGIAIPGSQSCSRCCNRECGYATGYESTIVARDTIYEEKASLIYQNLDFVVEKVVEHIRSRIFNGNVLEKPDKALVEA